MCVVGGVDGASPSLGHSAAKQRCPDTVVDTARRVLVKCQENKRPLIIEAGVFEKGDQPVFKPLRHEIDVGVMSVIDKVGGDKDPLWDSGRVDIGSEVVEVTQEGCTGGDVGDRVIQNEGIVFADVERVWRSRGVQVVG